MDAEERDGEVSGDHGLQAVVGGGPEKEIDEGGERAELVAASGPELDDASDVDTGNPAHEDEEASSKVPDNAVGEPVLVGAISHIMKTLFRDLYDNPPCFPEPIRDTKPRPPPRETEEKRPGKGEGQQEGKDQENEMTQEGEEEKDQQEGMEEVETAEEQKAVGGGNEDEIENGLKAESGPNGTDGEDRIDEQKPELLDDEAPSAARRPADPEDKPVEENGVDDSTEGLQRSVEGENEEQPLEGEEEGQQEPARQGVAQRNIERDPQKGTEVRVNQGASGSVEDSGPPLPSTRAQAVRDIAAIEQRLQREQHRFQRVLNMLNEAKMRAEEQDKREEDELKKQGVLISAHIPRGLSQLSQTMRDLHDERRDGMDECRSIVSALRAPPSFTFCHTFIKKLVVVQDLMFAAAEGIISAMGEG